MICFLDYDGTLVDDYDKANNLNIEFIKKYKNSFVLASGRCLTQINHIFQKYDFAIDVIGGNGSFFIRNGRINILNVIESQLIIKIIRLIAPLNVPIIVHTINDTYTVDYNSTSLNLENIIKIANEYSRHILNKPIASSNIIKLYNDTFSTKYLSRISVAEVRKLTNITGLEFFFQTTDVRKQILNILLNFGSFTESYYTSIEFNGGATKGNGIKNYLLSRSDEVTYSIGNDQNDITMFQETNIPLKVKNSNPKLPAVPIPYGPLDPYLELLFKLK